MADISPPSKRRRLTHSSSSLLEKNSHPLAPPVPSNHLRIFSWNINGINPLLQPPLTSFFNSGSSAVSITAHQGSPKSPLRAFLARHDYPQVLCLQEVKISSKDETTKRSVVQAANRGKDQGPGYVVKFCLPRDKHNARGFGGKVYGVATLIRQDFYEESVSGIRECGWDLEGRLLVLEMKNGWRIFNIYAVNGTTNPYRCPQTGAVVGTRYDRKLAFHTLLLAECKKMEAQGYELVLVGDMNVARAEIDGHPNLRLGQEHVKNRKDFIDKFLGEGEGLAAVDAFRHMHGDESKFTYYPRGVPFGASCDRVDWVLLSGSLVKEGGLIDADILNTPQERGHSDHVPLFATLDVDKARVRI